MFKIEINPQFERLTGQQREIFLTGQTVREVAPELEEEWYEFYGTVGLTGIPAHREIHAEAWGRWFEVSAYRTGAPQQRRVAILFTEITKRKQAEQALRQSEERLQKAISIETVGVLFFNLNGQIADANDAFLRMSGYSRDELINMTNWRVLTAPEFWEVTACTAEKLATRGESAPYEKQMVRQDGSRWWGLFSPTRLEGSGWNAECVEFIIDISDRKRAEANLQESEARWINPQFLSYVFEYFRQEDGSTTRQFGGLGLGLAIARQIVELHGGTVRVQSQGEGQGATFIVQLPAMRVGSIVSEPVEIQTDATLPLEGIHILLVDDEPDTREFQAFLLEQSGARVTAVASGLEALQALEQSIPDVLISDIGMAQMDGYMLLGQIRSRPTEQGGMIPTIALTAYTAQIDRHRALQVGFQSFITKPVEPEILVRAIATLLGRT
ncbi:PAS domain S-box protein [Phormidium sp. LEGE 05292]|uniref:PAS domain S-box protein n=1 Tax=[Phormidium] sp. LEGE 05292 TaxID=767427 RepID=UPI0018823D31|nr:PAS domain S-box protein [Phormidium sp. LEGE 05292]MBE9228334.1 PAS domain S-box protein [Phormidium sp. LEGE 05292]